MIFDKFKERQGITGQNVCGEEKSINSSVVDTCAECLPNIWCSYRPRDRFNADKTGLLWKATPTQTLHFAEPEGLLLPGNDLENAAVFA